MWMYPTTDFQWSLDLMWSFGHRCAAEKEPQGMHSGENILLPLYACVCTKWLKVSRFAGLQSDWQLIKLNGTGQFNRTFSLASHEYLWTHILFCNLVLIFINQKDLTPNKNIQNKQHKIFTTFCTVSLSYLKTCQNSDCLNLLSLPWNHCQIYPYLQPL